MEIYTIGFTRSTAEHFFTRLKNAGIKCLIDVRLNNRSQLAGFAKQTDLAFFLRELCGAEYRHEPLLAPSQEMLDAYKKHSGSWESYEQDFQALLTERKVEDHLDKALFVAPTVLLCSEHTAEFCHRRLVVEYLAARWGDMQSIDL